MEPGIEPVITVQQAEAISITPSSGFFQLKYVLYYCLLRRDKRK